MKLNPDALLFAAFFIGGLPSGALAKPTATVLDQTLNQIGSSAQTSAVVVKLSDGQAIFERNADELLSPASVTKLLTSATALFRFGPSKTFKTEVYYSGTRTGNRIKGDLVVVGAGDPLLVSEKLWQFAADMRNSGIEDISGDIVIDNSLFGGEARDRSRLPGASQSVNAYDAPVSALGINFNTIAVAVSPGDKVGVPARASIDPYPLLDTIIDNKATTARGSTASIQVRRVGDETKTPRLEITGSIGIDAPMKKIYRSVADHIGSTGEYIRAFLAADGVRVTGKVREGKKPNDARHLIDIEGYEVRRIVQGLNTFSNNYIADVLLKRLGAEYPSAQGAQGGSSGRAGPGTFENGLVVVKDFLVREVGIKTPMTLENGSGLDTRNRLSARQVAAVLMFMEKHMVVFPDFIGGLPAYGWDGTLKKRARGGLTSIHGLVRAKTGTLSEPVTVVSLAGYLRHKTHGLLAFAIIQNGRLGAPQPAVGDLRALQDEFVAALLD